MLKAVPSKENQMQARLAAPATLIKVRPDPNRIAVFANRNARKVSDRLAKRLERLVGSDHFFYSRSLEEAEAIAREIVQRGYGTVVCGGGDGTLARAINMVLKYIDEANAWRIERFKRYGEVQNLLEAPRFGFLRLGTGNGMSRVVGARNPLDDLQRIVDYAPGRTHEISLIEHGGEHFFFGGLGYDSIVLDDYNALKSRTQNPILKPFMQGLGGYFAAVLSQTLPRYLLGRQNRLEGRVISRGRAFYIDPRRGDAAIEIEPGSTLFEGNATMIAAGCSPFFGYGFKVFPFANMMPKMMQLRITNMGPLSALAAIPSLWRGHYRNRRSIFDFLVEDVRIELDHEFPFQHSGDAQGVRQEVDMHVAPDPLRLVDYYSPLIANR
ncbi:MAG: diacylglycerol kinase family protein [Myxococcota bacterium]